MQIQPFKKLIIGPGIELRRPVLTEARAIEMFELLKRNDFFYPWRLSFRSYTSPADCMELIKKRLTDIEAMTDSFYDIFLDHKYVGEIYARDIDYKFNVVKNLGYFVDKDRQGNGVATTAVNTLATELFNNGVHRICLFTHFFDPKELNIASENVAKKCGFTFEGTSRDAIYDIIGNRYASEHMFSLLSTDVAQK